MLIYERVKDVKNLNNSLKTRTGFFKKIGPGIARHMSEALQKLTGEKIKVKFSSVQTFDHSKVFVDVGEKCFGSYVTFKSPRDNFEGIALAIFPRSSTKTLTALLLKRYLRELGKEAIDYRMKLSAFKEAANILNLTYITGAANALKVNLKISVPKFVCFENVEFARSAVLRGHSKPDSLFSVGQFVISHPSSSSIKGRFVIVF